MLVFFVKRLLMSLLVVLISTVIMYVLVDISIDPLEDLRTSTAPNKARADRQPHRRAQARRPDPLRATSRLAAGRRAAASTAAATSARTG